VFVRKAELHGGSGARLAPRDPNNPNTFKTREGVVGKPSIVQLFFETHNLPMKNK
jgi:hypothetical protein